MIPQAPSARSKVTHDIMGAAIGSEVALLSNTRAALMRGTVAGNLENSCWSLPAKALSLHCPERVHGERRLTKRSPGPHEILGLE